MKALLTISIAAALLLLTAFAQKMERKTGNGDEREALARFERACADALGQRDFQRLENFLAEDFRATSADGTADRTTFLARLRQRDAPRESITLDDTDLHLYGDDTGVSTGSATLQPSRRNSNSNTSGAPIKGEPAVVSGSATVNMSELARREAAQPRPTKEKGRAIHSPGKTPDNQPLMDAPETNAGSVASQQYRYTAVYIKRAGRWQAVALHLTPVVQP